MVFTPENTELDFIPYFGSVIDYGDNGVDEILNLEGTFLKLILSKILDMADHYLSTGEPILLLILSLLTDNVFLFIGVWANVVTLVLFNLLNFFCLLA